MNNNYNLLVLLIKYFTLNNYVCYYDAVKTNCIDIENML